MWGRVIEVMLGLWLSISPFIFGHYPGNRPLWISDLICGLAVVMLALLSWARVLRHAHLLILPVACWLIGFGYIHGGYPSSPGHQNNIFIGLTLLLFAIIPKEANQPPPAWRRYYQERAQALRLPEKNC